MTLDERNAARLTRIERDADICKRYLAGATLAECGAPYNIKRQRVKQILKKLGVWRPRIVMTPESDEFLGVNLSESDKIALKIEADRRGVSMAKLTRMILREVVPRPTLVEEIAAREEQLAELKEKR